jgi:hypothetical protein
MPAWWPGRAVFYTALAVGLVAAVFGGLIYGAVFGAAFLVWGVGPWGHLIGLGRFAPDRPPSDLERVLLRLAGGNVHVALALRHAVAVPFLLPFGLLALTFPFVAVAAYEAAWRIRPANPIWIAELSVGALWGALIVSLA